ncbi:MAG: hypothetical protein JO233_06475, partial [Candidatus Eremiobacteraeota bacterium]|nr:hypothetical protein [Candidatus Eremiobacteraeota bacterium]
MTRHSSLVTSLAIAGLALCALNAPARAQDPVTQPASQEAVSKDPVTTIPSGLIRLSANQVEFYYDRFVIQADGNVNVALPGGVDVTGDAFSMDLRLHRFLVAGNVAISAGAQTLHGAAMSDFLNFHRVYFVPVTDQPDRWTYLD